MWTKFYANSQKSMDYIIMWLENEKKMFFLDLWLKFHIAEMVAVKLHEKKKIENILKFIFFII